MKIIEIYSKYKIPPNLQLHMLRVAAVGNTIASNWKQKDVINVDRATKTLLLHDMANIIVFDFDKNPGLLGDEEKNIDYWKSVQKQFLKVYGPDEHKAVLVIARDVGLDKKGIKILEKMPEIDSKHRIPKNERELAICWYSDFRVAPHGVTNVNDRLDNLIKRRKAKGVSKEKIQALESLRDYCRSLEKEIQENTSINLISIDENMVQTKINKFLDMVI